jgi:hypothetical protein
LAINYLLTIHINLSIKPIEIGYVMIQRKILTTLYLLLVLLVSNTAAAQTFTAVCSDIEGNILRYFNHNNLNKANNTFITEQDSITSSKITLIWDMDKKSAILIHPDTDDGAPNSARLTLLKLDKDQITFVGSLNSTPIMFSIYPLLKVSIYSLQGYSNPPFSTGVIANNFHTNCNINVNDMK